MTLISNPSFANEATLKDAIVLLAMNSYIMGCVDGKEISKEQDINKRREMWNVCETWAKKFADENFKK